MGGGKLCSLLDDADLGCAQDAIANSPASLHHDLYSIIFILGLRHCEDCLVQIGVELLALRVILSHLKALQNFVHHVCGHALTLHVPLELLLDVLKVLRGTDLFHVCVFEGQTHGISHLEQVLGELGNGKLLLIFDHFAVALHSLLVLFDLLCVLDAGQGHLFLLAVRQRLQLLNLLLKGLDFSLLLVEQLLNAFDILW